MVELALIGSISANFQAQVTPPGERGATEFGGLPPSRSRGIFPGIVHCIANLQDHKQA